MKLRSMFLKALFTAAILPAVMLTGCSNSTDPDTASGKPTGTLYVTGGYGSDRNIYSLNLQSGTSTNLFEGTEPYVTPEGTVICVILGDLVEISKDATSKRVIVKSHVQAPMDVTYDDAFNNPQLSPDGKYIAYEGQFGYRYDVYVVERQTGKLVGQFYDKNNEVGFERPSWTQDGRIVFSGWTARNPGLYITSKDFTTYERIDNNLNGPSQPMVSPDGTKIAFIMNSHLYTINLDGTGLQQITTSNWSESWPIWSPDSKWIAIFGSSTIYMLPMKEDGYVNVNNINNSFVYTTHKDSQMHWVK